MIGFHKEIRNLLLSQTLHSLMLRSEVQALKKRGGINREKTSSSFSSLHLTWEQQHSIPEESMWCSSPAVTGFLLF